MTDQSTVWTEVKEVYPTPFLKAVTNLHDRTASAPDDTVGERAALHILGLWESHVEVEFSASNTAHLALAVEMTIATLLERRHPGSAKAKTACDRVFGDDGLVFKFRRTGPRGRRGPAISGPDLKNGQEQRAYSHRKSLPSNFLPSTRRDDFSGDDV